MAEISGNSEYGKYTLDCMTLIAGKNATKSGHVLVGHNEDDYVHACVRHGYMPACDYKDDDTMPAENGNIAIPQVKHTLGYWWSEVRGPECGLSTADAFYNECGVCVVSNSSCGSKEDALEENHQPGIVYELRRAIAERAHSAREGMNVARELLEKYGYASPGRIYTIADKDEAFMIQVARGHRYLAARVPDDAVVAMPNHYTMHSLKDIAEMYYPNDLIQHAIANEWYKPQIENNFDDFDFAAAYQNADMIKNPVNTLRQKYALQMLLGREWDAEKEGFPFCVKGAEKLSKDDFMRVLSTHYEGRDCDKRFGAGKTPHFTNVRRICTGSTVESNVFEFADTPKLTTVWTAYGRPCEVPYIPSHPLCGITPLIGKMDNPQKEAALHFEKQPGLTQYRNDGWQKFKDFQNEAECTYSECIDRISFMKTELQKEFDKANLETISGLYTDEQIVRRDTAAVMQALNEIDKVSASFRRVKVTNVNLTFDNEKKLTAKVNFSAEGSIDKESLLFGVGGTSVNKEFAKCDSLEMNGSLAEARFVFEKDPLELDGEGTYEFFLSGKYEKRTSFGAMTLVEYKYSKK